MTKERKTLIALAAAGKTTVDASQMADDQNTFDCETVACAFNKDGSCKFHAVENEFPVLTEEDGCLSGITEEV